MPRFSKHSDGAGGWGECVGGWLFKLCSVPWSCLDRLDMQCLENLHASLSTCWKSFLSRKGSWIKDCWVYLRTVSWTFLCYSVLCWHFRCNLGYFLAQQKMHMRKKNKKQTKKAHRRIDKERKQSKYQLGSERLRPQFWKLLQSALPVILNPYLLYNLCFSYYSTPE